MIKKICGLKIKLLFALIALLFIFNTNAYSAWLYSDVHQGLAWINDDLTFPYNQWYLIDEDGDGVGYYYYFDENGMLLMDNIAPDYRIVNEQGQRLLINGDVETVGSVIKTDDGTFVGEDEANTELYELAQKKNITSIISNQVISNELVEQVQNDKHQFDATLNKNLTSSVILGKNVVIVEDKEMYDVNLDRDVKKYIKTSSNFSKKVNGTTFTKVKWKEVMSLKGNEAYVEFENPSNNFNRIRGRVATHYFSYSDRTTSCSIEVFADGDEIFTINGFDYNSGVSFDILFPRKTKILRFYLAVEGQYTTRVVYLKDVKYSFNKAAYKEELEEDEENAEWEKLLKEMDPNYKADNEFDTLLGSGSTEVTPEEETEEETDEYGNTKADKDRDKTSGPSFDKNLNATRSEVLGPDGQAQWRFIPAK